MLEKKLDVDPDPRRLWIWTPLHRTGVPIAMKRIYTEVADIAKQCGPSSPAYEFKEPFAVNMLLYCVNDLTRVNFALTAAEALELASMLQSAGEEAQRHIGHANE